MQQCSNSRICEESIAYFSLHADCCSGRSVLPLDPAGLDFIKHTAAYWTTCMKMYEIDWSLFEPHWSQTSVVDFSWFAAEFRWAVTQVIVDAQNDSIFGVPPPMVSRTLAELSSGMGKFGDAKKSLGNVNWMELRMETELIGHLSV